MGKTVPHLQLRTGNIHRRYRMNKRLASNKMGDYATHHHLITLMILKRLSSPYLWGEFEELFGKHASQLSTMFWEGMEALIVRRSHLILDTILKYLIEENEKRFSSETKQKGVVLDCCVFGFVMELYLEFPDRMMR